MLGCTRLQHSSNRSNIRYMSCRNTYISGAESASPAKGRRLHAEWQWTFGEIAWDIQTGQFTGVLQLNICVVARDFSGQEASTWPTSIKAPSSACTCRLQCINSAFVDHIIDGMLILQHADALSSSSSLNIPWLVLSANQTLLSLKAIDRESQSRHHPAGGAHFGCAECSRAAEVAEAL